MSISELKQRLENNSNKEAIIYADKIFLYSDIISLVDQWTNYLKSNQVESGKVVAVIGEYSPDSIALLLALVFNNNILVPLTPHAQSQFSEYIDISQTQYIIDLSTNPHKLTKIDAFHKGNDLLKELIERKHPGLILFTSGSTGRPKAALHDFNNFLLKFLSAAKSYRTLCFLLFDHIAGIDTYFYSFFSGGVLIFPHTREPGEICELIEKHNVEVLPTSPTFLNLLLISGEHQRHNLKSLKIITFGTERMPASLLSKLNEAFPKVRLIQKYGTTELGSPTSKSRESDSIWIKMNSKQFQTKVTNGMLYIKADSAMLGYLNAPSPFTKDGWFNTEDAVKSDGEYLQVLGKKSEVINVGGEKVFPTEIEDVIYMMSGVEDVAVSGVENVIMGQVIQARVKLNTGETLSDFRVRMRTFCESKLRNFMIPQKVILSNHSFHGNRIKKMRVK